MTNGESRHDPDDGVASRLPAAVDDVTFTRRAAYVGDADSLVVADLHVGRDAGTNLELPLGEREALVDRLEDLLDRFEPRRTVVAGDLLDSFGSIPEPVSETLRELRDAVTDAGSTFSVTIGNHDTMLDYLFDGELEPAIDLGEGTVVSHGQDPAPTTADRYVVGHDHPTIRISGRKYPCALVGPAGHRSTTDAVPERPAAVDPPTVVVLPAFSPLTRGTTINNLRGVDLQTPFVDDLDPFQPVVTVDGETRTFPRLGRIRDQL